MPYYNCMDQFSDSGPQLYVFPWVPDRSDDLAVEYRRQQDLTDFQVGGIIVDDIPQRPYFLRTHTYLLDGVAEISRFKRFFTDMGGRRCPFWVRSEEANMEVLLCSGNQLTVRAGGFSLVSQLKGRTVVAVFANGEWQYQTVSSIRIDDPNSGTEIVQLGSSLWGVSAGDIMQVSWMEKSRFASDALEVAWETDTLARARVQFQSVDVISSGGSGPAT